MKRLLSILGFILFVHARTLAQDCPLPSLLGTKTLYSAPLGAKLTADPKGYIPVFINHVGRHGARHLTKPVESSFAYQLLRKADTNGQLAEKGKRLVQMVEALRHVESGNIKSISIEGESELEGIGERMAANYDPVFRGAAVRVRITKEIRTKQSAEAFLRGLRKNSSDSQRVRLQEKIPSRFRIVGLQEDNIGLRFYDFSPVYAQFKQDVDKGTLENSFKEQLHIDQINDTLVSTLFKASFLSSLKASQKEKFVSDLFGFATITYSLVREIEKAGLKKEDLDFSIFFTCEQIKKLARLDEAEEFWQKGPGIDNMGIQVRIAAPLLADFIKSTDDFIQSKRDKVEPHKAGLHTAKSYQAELRFAHAETIAPFAALLRIEGAEKAVQEPNQINAAWQASKVIPLSANIQWILYRRKAMGLKDVSHQQSALKPQRLMYSRRASVQKSGSEEYLIKVLLNEREVRIAGLASFEHGGAYYRWNTLRSFYMKILSSLHVGLRKFN